MREFINKDEYKKIKKQYKNKSDCCYIKLNGKKLPTLDLYYEKLRNKLQLNDSFSNNLNAYSDMMCDAYSYYNKNTIIFIIKHYEEFLGQDKSKKAIENIFDKDIIPYFRQNIRAITKEEEKEIHVYCINE